MPERLRAPNDDGARKMLDELLGRTSFSSPGTNVDCAVSGGADSLSLLALAVHAGLRVTAWHVDHGLRYGSASEACVVEAAASHLGARFRSVSAHVKSGPNLEARARAARYAALPADVKTGHTSDDQAETVLMNLMRGAGIDGLGGMRPDNKPILCLRRHETVALCRALDLAVVTDPTNTDPSILRNRVRHELVPLMNDIASRDVCDVISRQTVVLQNESKFLESLANEVECFDAKQLAREPEVVAVRALRAWLRTQLDDEVHPPDMATIERAMRVVRGEVRACELPGSKRLVRSSQRLSVVDVTDESRML